MKTNKKRNLKKAGFVAGVLCLASIGGVSAYLTDFDKADNQFTVGKVSIDLDEPGFKPEEQTKIEPGKDVKKDPQIKNTGVNDAFVYLEVSIPMAEVEAASEDGTRLGKEGTAFTPYALLILAVGCMILFIVSVLQERGIRIRETLSRCSLPVTVAIYFCLLLSIGFFGSTAAVRGFIYAQF